jgi:hypothetical protein
MLLRGSRPVLVDYQDEDGNWRQKVKMERIKFDDKAKGVFLDEYRQWGRIGDAAAKVGVTIGCVRDHVDKDEDFAVAFLMAEEEYKNKVIEHVQDLIFNGTEKITYARDGSIASTERIYPIRLIEMEMKKIDEGYREKQELKVNHTGGVLIAPTEMASIDAWEKKFKNAIDVTPSSVMIEVEDDKDED